MSMSYQIRQQLVLKFFREKVLSPWKTGKLASFVFTVLQKHIKIETPFSNTIRVAEWIKDLLS